MKIGFGERISRALKMRSEKSGETPIGDIVPLDNLPKELREFVGEISRNMASEGGVIHLAKGRNSGDLMFNKQLKGQLETFLSNNKGPWRIYEDVGDDGYKISETLEYDRSRQTLIDRGPTQAGVL